MLLQLLKGQTYLPGFSSHLVPVQLGGHLHTGKPLCVVQVPSLRQKFLQGSEIKQLVKTLRK